jgi:hypothetical protein
MPSDTPTTEAGRRLAVETYGEDSLLSEKMGHRIAAIEAEAVRSFVERVQEKIGDLPTTHSHDAQVDVLAHPFVERAAVLALLQAETPDASDSGEGGTAPRYRLGHAAMNPDPLCPADFMAEPERADRTLLVVAVLALLAVVVLLRR